MDPRPIDAHNYRRELERIKAFNQNSGAHPKANVGINQALGALTLEPTFRAGMEWISTEDKLPEFGRTVIVCRRSKDGVRTEQGNLGVNGWWNVYGTRTKSVTHWMPMPEPPTAATAMRKR